MSVTVGFQNVHHRWSTTRKKVGGFGVIFVRKHPFAPGLHDVQKIF